MSSLSGHVRTEFVAATADHSYDETSEDERRADSGDQVDNDFSDTTRQLTHCFLRLANLDSGVFERLNRYEVALWRQTVQVLFALHPIKQR